MTLDNVTDLERIGDLVELGRLERSERSSRDRLADNLLSDHVVGTRPLIRSIPDRVLKSLVAVLRHALRVGEDLGDAIGHTDLVDAQIRIRTDDCAT